MVYSVAFPQRQRGDDLYLIPDEFSHLFVNSIDVVNPPIDQEVIHFNGQAQAGAFPVDLLLQRFEFLRVLVMGVFVVFIIRIVRPDHKLFFRFEVCGDIVLQESGDFPHLFSTFSCRVQKLIDFPEKLPVLIVNDTDPSQ